MEKIVNIIFTLGVGFSISALWVLVYRYNKLTNRLICDIFEHEKRINYLTYNQAINIVNHLEGKGELDLKELAILTDAKKFIVEFEQKYKTPQN